MTSSKNNLTKLKEKLTSIALNSKEFKGALKQATEEINDEAKTAPNEATIEGAFERIIYATLRDVGIKFSPEKEITVETIRHTGKGRVDSRIGVVVIEYKHRSKLKSSKDISSAKEQLEDYITSISKDVDNTVIGFITDGLSLYEIRTLQGDVTSRSGKLKIDENTLLLLIKSVVLLEQAALTSENLIRDFCGSSLDGVLFDLARILSEVLIKKSTKKTDMLRKEWGELFRLAHDDQSQQRTIQERRKALSEIFNENPKNTKSEYRNLFALHTAYAILLKLMAYRVVSDIQFGSPLQNYKSLIGGDSQVLQSFCFRLEEGEIFRELGILNLLEGDFFSWYCDENQWDNELASALSNILEILGRYEDVSSIFSSADAIDLFRELYEATVPQIVRSSFGEFYTPFWLAQNVLKSSGFRKNWRALDPCCGSGTFVIAAISRIRADKKTSPKDEVLKEILTRVTAIDLNPLAVLTTRIHYFIHIADLLPTNLEDLVIPVFLGDSSYVPEKVDIGSVKCLKYQLRTLKNPISIEIPISLVEETPKFVQLMYKYEKFVRNIDAESATNLIIRSLDENDKNQEIEEKIGILTNQLVELERKKWNGIWARIITNFLITACLEPFTNVIGNPPWIDWKNLPVGYREKIKSICVDKGLFSGAGRTGGINLNVCALITHVAATNWLSKTGKLAFLMPKELAYQASYEGWRRSVGGTTRNLLEFHDWSKAGHPFYPVTEDFMTYIIGKKHSNSMNKIPVSKYTKKKEVKTKANQWTKINEANKNLDIVHNVAGQIIPGSTIYTFAENDDQLHDFSKVAGECKYVGREGIEFYPQELLVFEYENKGPKPGTVILKNIQTKRSKYRIPKQKVILETKFLYPLVKGPAIKPFSHNYEKLIVPFPYKKENPNKPIDAKRLAKESPLLFSHYKKYEKIIKAQTDFSDKIRGSDAGDFYGLARTGPYSFHDVHVGFRDNTKWEAVVVTESNMPWGGKKRFVFQNHAVSICERNDGTGYITEDEAHFVCAILNAPIVKEFIYSSSDNRSFKIRPPVFIPKYDANNNKHKCLSELSRKAHKSNSDNYKDILSVIETLYLKICEEEK